MKIVPILASLVLLTAPLRAGSLEDLRAYLETHAGQDPIRINISGEFRQTEGSNNQALKDLPAFPIQLKVSDGPSGFQIFWDPKILAGAPESSLAEDLWLTLPNLPHGSTAWLDPVCLYRTTNPVRSMQRLMSAAKLEDAREVVWNGQAAQRLTLRFKCPLPDRFRPQFRRGLKTFPTGTLTVWVASDGAPLASEVKIQYRLGLGLLFGDFARKTTEKVTYQHAGNRIISATQLVEDETDIERHSTRTMLNLKVEVEKL